MHVFNTTTETLIISGTGDLVAFPGPLNSPTVSCGTIAGSFDGTMCVLELNKT